MVKQPAMEASEFQMSNEDFPALPGLSGPAPGQSAPAAPVPSSMDDLSGAPGALPNQLGGQPQGVIGSTISSSDMILQSTQQGKNSLEFFTFSENFTTCALSMAWIFVRNSNLSQPEDCWFNSTVLSNSQKLNWQKWVKWWNSGLFKRNIMIIWPSCPVLAPPHNKWTTPSHN